MTKMKTHMPGNKCSKLSNNPFLVPGLKMAMPRKPGHSRDLFTTTTRNFKEYLIITSNSMTHRFIFQAMKYPEFHKLQEEVNQFYKTLI